MRRLAPSHAIYLLIALQAALVLWGVHAPEVFGATYVDALAAVVTAILVELACANVQGHLAGKPRLLYFPASAAAAGLGIALFFRALSPWYVALAAALAILSKYVIRIRGRYVFNPSNFAVVTLAVLLPMATTIDVTQWGSNPATFVVVALIGFLIAFVAGAIVTTLAFLASYCGLLLICLLLDPTLFATHHVGVLGPSLVLFASFMITDPKTSPQDFYGRIVHGITVALLYFAFESFGVNYGLSSRRSVRRSSMQHCDTSPRRESAQRMRPPRSLLSPCSSLVSHPYQ